MLIFVFFQTKSLSEQTAMIKNHLEIIDNLKKSWPNVLSSYNLKTLFKITDHRFFRCNSIHKINPRNRTGHCGLCSHMKRIGISWSPSALYDCGAQQTIHHTLQDCPKLEAQRRQSWAQEVPISTKLYGKVNDLRCTVQFLATWNAEEKELCCFNLRSAKCQGYKD